ncbi:MAG: hypothetical protein AAF583_17455, partial [Pseudomonadota bacterium]
MPVSAACSACAFLEALHAAIAGFDRVIRPRISALPALDPPVEPGDDTVCTATIPRVARAHRAAISSLLHSGAAAAILSALAGSWAWWRGGTSGPLTEDRSDWTDRTGCREHP